MDNERKNLPSASSWHRYEICHGSYQLEQEAARLGQSAHRSSPEAQAGERIHAWIEGKHDAVKNESEANTGQFLKERGDEQVTRIFGDQHYDQIHEKRLWLSVNGKPALSGRFDRVTFTPELVLVQDWKTGWSEPQAAEQNAQMRVLAVLVALSLPSATEIVVQVVSGPFGVTEARYDIAALGAAYEEILVTLRAINSPIAPFTPSAEACKYCGAKLICQALKDQVVRPLTKLRVSTLPDEPARVATLLDEVAFFEEKIFGLPEDGLLAGKLLDAVLIMESLLAEIKGFYAEKFNDPTFKIPGWAMVPGVTRREVTDWEAARTRLEAYIDADEIRGAAAYRLGDIEKAVGKALKLKGKPLKDKMAEILSGLIYDKQNAASLKRVKGEPKVMELAV
jgi:hypothetical protein